MRWGYGMESFGLLMKMDFMSINRQEIDIIKKDTKLKRIKTGNCNIMMGKDFWSYKIKTAR